jgi:hypothetical protein
MNVERAHANSPVAIRMIVNPAKEDAANRVSVRSLLEVQHAQHNEEVTDQEEFISTAPEWVDGEETQEGQSGYGHYATSEPCFLQVFDISRSAAVRSCKLRVLKAVIIIYFCLICPFE